MDFDDKMETKLSRRDVLSSSIAIAGAAVASSFTLSSAFAASFPDRDLSVYIPTRAGGGADRLNRAVTGIWKKYLGANFKSSFYPGASGRVGYEKYMGIAKDDGHELLFGNMGPEVLNWVVKKPTFDLNAFKYFAQLDADPGVIFVSRKSKFKTIDDIIAEGKKRRLNVGVSRLAHPATLGVLALARHTGANLNVIPLSGGKNTYAGAATGEMDLAALPSGGVISRSKSFKILLMMSHSNPLPGRTDNAPVLNDHFKMNMPSLVAGARAYGVKASAITKYPGNFKKLETTLKQTIADPAFKKAYLKTKNPWEYVGYRGADEAAAYVKGITEIGKEFKALLTGKK
jgi:putative tricarboxylic transport membrane protein